MSGIYVEIICLLNTCFFLISPRVAQKCACCVFDFRNLSVSITKRKNIGQRSADWPKSTQNSPKKWENRQIQNDWFLITIEILFSTLRTPSLINMFVACKLLSTDNIYFLKGAWKIDTEEWKIAFLEVIYHAISQQFWCFRGADEPQFYWPHLGHFNIFSEP